MSELIEVTSQSGVMTLVMKRADKKNALTDAMYGDLADALAAAQENRSVRVILIRGDGEAFTAGNDIKEFAVAAASGGGLRNVLRFISALGSNAKPLVAAVQGHAVGIGTTMLLHCDHVILADDALLSTPFVNLALVPEAASSVLLTARIGHLRAFSMFALGEVVGASDAVMWGLANRVVPRDHLIAEAEAVVRRIALLPPAAVAITKRLMRDQEALSGAMERETNEFARRLSSSEAREAFTAFAERRAPDFSRLP